MSLSEREERAATAGEYVLGTLTAAEREAFEAALDQDPALQAEVAYWQDRLGPLLDRVPPVEPPAGLWAQLETRLRAPEAATPGGESRAVPQAEAANDPGLPGRLRAWKAFSALSSAAAVLLAVLLVRQLEAPPPARYLAVLEAPGDQRNGWLVEATAGGRLRLIPMLPPEAVPPGKALQFWTKAEGAAGPTSLGLVRPGQPVELPVQLLPALGARQLFELTLEPEAGSPLDRPTGPILYLGRSVRL